jgi:hypothetical protein
VKGSIFIKRLRQARACHRAYYRPGNRESK